MKASDIYEKIYAFFDSCRNVYCYGNGHYGKALLHLLEHSGRSVSGVFVSADVCDEDVVSFSAACDKLDFCDGIIFAMSEKNVAGLGRHVKQFSKCFFLKDWELDEVCKLDYYLTVGNMPSVNGFTFYYHKVINRIKRFKHRMLIHDKNIEPWHMISKDEKPYCEEIVRYILEKQMYGAIVELGCGLCDIIGDRRLKKYERIGMDIDDKVIAEARLHHSDIKLKNGSFDDIGTGKTIRFLIMVNFLHTIPMEVLREKLERIFSRNTVDFFIADEVTGNYKYTYGIEDVLPHGYVLDKMIGIHPSDGGVRVIKAFSGIKD